MPTRSVPSLSRLRVLAQERTRRAFSIWGDGQGLRSNFGVHFHERTERATRIGTDTGPVP
jgi:hypothetical protein